MAQKHIVISMIAALTVVGILIMAAISSTNEAFASSGNNDIRLGSTNFGFGNSGNNNIGLFHGNPLMNVNGFHSFNVRNPVHTHGGEQ
jgi:hypothetical protein